MLALLEEGDRANTDDRPVLEFRAPRGLLLGPGSNPERLLAAKLRAGLAPPPLVGAPPAEADLWLGVAAMYGSRAKSSAEVRTALNRALALGAPPLARVRAAEQSLNDGKAEVAARMLAGLEAAAGSADFARELAYARAHLLAVEGRVDEALAAYRETGEFAGDAGIEALAVEQKTGNAAGALELAERLLGAARPGGAVAAQGVAFVERALVDLALREGAGFAARALELARNLPADDGSFARVPRLKAIAALAELAGRNAEALAACEEIARRGALDRTVMVQRVRLLRAAGREAEAAGLERELAALLPEAAAGANAF
jgi:hypothetical protein